MPPRKKRRPSPLARALRDRIVERGLTKKEAAAELGFAYVHLLSLCKDVRRFSALKRDKMAALAKFLGVPLVNCYLLAGEFGPTDFVAEANLGDRLELTLSKLRGDPEWSAFAPDDPDWQQWPSSARVLLTLLYERVNLDTTRRIMGVRQ